MAVIEAKSASCSFDDKDTFQAVRGANDKHFKILERGLGIQVSVVGNECHLSGDDFAVDMGEKIITQLYEVCRKGHTIYPPDVKRAIEILSSNSNASLETVWLDTILIPAHNNSKIAPKNLAQKDYVEAIRKFDIVFGVGPAGTGKTYLAMAMAVAALSKNEYKRIVLARPAVEAGEKLGFLPGDLADKVNPYLRPLYDALNDMMDLNKARRLIESGVVEVAPLAFMRGRTLNDSFVILDEAQNTTIEQMKMFLTRLGYNSKAVITGDVTQTDLTPGRISGLKHALSILDDVKGISICKFTDRDVVRHSLVQKIIVAYEKWNNERDLRAVPGPANGEPPSSE
ncbi:MAG TPA: PhoH family protein [Myxococcales bacterium]|nr:PhoH family protein [Myxococcales bacterium]HIN86134.1 PhoH family protein [Myxococcales bacterium]